MTTTAFEAARSHIARAVAGNSPAIHRATFQDLCREAMRTQWRKDQKKNREKRRPVFSAGGTPPTKQSIGFVKGVKRETLDRLAICKALKAQGMTPIQISRQTGWSHESVKGYMSRIRAAEAAQ